jgi:hypothetical protein
MFMIAWSRVASFRPRKNTRENALNTKGKIKNLSIMETSLKSKKL